LGGNAELDQPEALHGPTTGGGAADKALVGGLGLGQFAGIHQALGALER